MGLRGAEIPAYIEEKYGIRKGRLLFPKTDDLPNWTNTDLCPQCTSWIYPVAKNEEAVRGAVSVAIYQTLASDRKLSISEKDKLLDLSMRRGNKAACQNFDEPIPFTTNVEDRGTLYTFRLIQPEVQSDEYLILQAPVRKIWEDFGFPRVIADVNYYENFLKYTVQDKNNFAPGSYKEIMTTLTNLWFDYRVLQNEIDYKMAIDHFFGILGDGRVRPLIDEAKKAIKVEDDLLPISPANKLKYFDYVYHRLDNDEKTRIGGLRKQTVSHNSKIVKGIVSYPAAIVTSIKLSGISAKYNSTTTGMDIDFSTVEGLAMYTVIRPVIGELTTHDQILELKRNVDEMLSENNIVQKTRVTG